MRLIDADAVIRFYEEHFPFGANEVRFSKNDIVKNLDNIPEEHIYGLSSGTLLLIIAALLIAVDAIIFLVVSIVRFGIII